MAARRGREMASLEERVAYLEGQTGEHTSTISELRLDVRDLRTEMNRRFDQVDARFAGMDAKFDLRFSQMDVRFAWLIGFQFATFMTIIAALLNVYFR